MFPEGTTCGDIYILYIVSLASYVWGYMTDRLRCVHPIAWNDLLTEFDETLPAVMVLADISLHTQLKPGVDREIKSIPYEALLRLGEAPIDELSSALPKPAVDWQSIIVRCAVR